MKFNPLFACDFYKTGHVFQYPKGTEIVYSNFTARSAKHAKVSKFYDNKVVFFGMDMKATWGQVNGEAREIFKDPVTDDGTKKSAVGRLRVERDGNDYVLHQHQTGKDFGQG